MSSWSGDRIAFTPPRRRRILRRDPVCVWCGQRPSTIADHRIPVVEARRLGIDDQDEENGQGMCAPCHDVKTKQEIARGRARKARKRQPEQHPGIIR